MIESDGDGSSDTEYFWFIAFEWNIHEPQPFQIFVREYFGDEDIPDNWFTGKLTEDNRAVKLSLNAVAGMSPYSIFAKVEKGIIVIIISNTMSSNSNSSSSSSSSSSNNNIYNWFLTDTSQQRRDKTVKDLNDAYAAQIGSMPMRKVYHEMIQTYSYRLLALFSYSKEPVSLRNHLHPQKCPVETDVSNN